MSHYKNNLSRALLDIYHDIGLHESLFELDAKRPKQKGEKEKEIGLGDALFELYKTKERRERGLEAN